MTVAQLRAKRREVWELLKELAADAAHECRSFTEVEQSQWDRLIRLMDEYDHRIRITAQAGLMPGERVFFPGDLKIPPPPPADVVTHSAHSCCCPRCPGECIEA